MRARICVDPHVAEVLAQGGLHPGARLRLQRLATVASGRDSIHHTR